jgi:cytochrome b561
MQRKTYHPLARVLHWAIFGLVLVGLPMGLVMVERDFDQINNVLYTFHWSIGLTVLALMIVRVIVRFAFPPPRPASVLTPVQRTLSQTVHIGLYVMLFVVPILGWLGKSAYGAEAQGISVFYLFHVPVLLDKDEDLAETLLGYHGIAVRVFMVFLVLHVAGALYHALIARDGVVGRMGLGGKVAEPEA